MDKEIYAFIESELMRLSFSEITDLAYVYDTDGNILFVNDVVEKFTGLRAEEYRGRSFVTLFHNSQPNKSMAAFTKVLQGASQKYEVYFYNTKVFCECKNHPVRDDGGNIIGVIGIGRDITAHKQSEKRLKTLKKSLEERVENYNCKLVDINKELTEEINNRKKMEGNLKKNIRTLQRSLLNTAQTLAFLVEVKDRYSKGHHKRVARIACSIAEEMSLSQEQIYVIHLAALFHDIGKISMPSNFFCNSEQLSDDEYEMIEEHPRLGYEILKKNQFISPLPEIVLQHHENIDGTGYPQGLSEDDLLIESKILRVSDVIDIMTSGRAHRPPYEMDEVLHEISKNSGNIYDINVVFACFSVFNKSPINNTYIRVKA